MKDQRAEKPSIVVREGRQVRPFPIAKEPLSEYPVGPVKRRIRYVIFDFGGVLVTEGLSKARRVYGKRISSDIVGIWKGAMQPKWKKWERGEIGEDEFWSALVKEINNPLFDLETFKKMFWGMMERDGIILELIRRLRKEGYVTALLTNNTKEWVERYNAEHPLSDKFDLVVSSHDVGMIKPDPEIYELTMQRLDARPEECVFIDDKERNVETACRLGMKGIICKTGGLQVMGDLDKILKENRGNGTKSRNDRR